MLECEVVLVDLELFFIAYKVYLNYKHDAYG